MNILLASYGGAHVRMLLPILPILKRQGHHVVPLALTTAPRIYKKANTEHRTITDFVKTNAEIEAIAQPLLSKHHNPDAEISLAESTAYLGASMRDLIADIGEKAAWESYNQHGLNAFEPRATAHSIIEQTQADLVIATCSPRMERALLAEAVAMNIPAVCLVALFPLIGMPYLARPDNGHLIFVGSERFKNQLMAHGRPENSIRIMGNPAFDLLKPEDAVSRRLTLRKARKLNANSSVVLWAEQPEPYANARWPEMVRNEVFTLANMDDALVPMIRLHPSSQIGQQITLPKGVELSPATEDATDALLTADILVTATSTIGYEAALMGKDVIIIRGSHYDTMADYCEQDGVMVIDDYRHLSDAVRHFIQNSDLAAHIRKCRDSLPSPGNFAKQTVDTILNWHHAR